MASSHGSTSWVWRRLRWLLVALMLPFMLPAGVEPVAAETPPGYGFQWGPSRPPGTFESVLDDPNVRWALNFFVDEDSISTRVLGEPSLLVYADDATYPNELDSGSTIFAPEKGKYLLEATGVHRLTLTIAADPQLPESRQLAEAIAEDLRNNAGAQVGIVDVDSDFVVGVRWASRPRPPRGRFRSKRPARPIPSASTNGRSSNASARYATRARPP